MKVPSNKAVKQLNLKILYNFSTRSKKTLAFTCRPEKYNGKREQDLVMNVA